MRIFLSYASEDREQGKSVYLALREQGHQVFFDRANLPAGEEYHNRIRAAIEKSYLFIILISPQAIDGGSYTLTELAIAEQAGIKLLPAILRRVDPGQLPASIQNLTFLETDGNLPAAVAAEGHRIARERRRRLLKYGTVAAGLIVLAGAALFSTVKKPATAPAAKQGMASISIPAGSFIMGGDDESPRREVFLDAFDIDKFEVTVAQYAKFLRATGNVKPPEEWETVNPENGADLPVVGVDWPDADSFCRWAGKRLLTEAEWEKAARGTDGRKYPWGIETPTAEHARFAKSYQNPVYKDGVARVGTHTQGASPYGVNDMVGNVSEWVADWFSESFRSGDLRNPKGPDSGTAKVLRGGGWYDPPEGITTTKRFHAKPDHRADDIGFRCAADVK